MPPAPPRSQIPPGAPWHGGVASCHEVTSPRPHVPALAVAQPHLSLLPSPCPLLCSTLCFSRGHARVPSVLPLLPPHHHIHSFSLAPLPLPLPPMPCVTSRARAKLSIAITPLPLPPSTLPIPFHILLSPPCPSHATALLLPPAEPPQGTAAPPAPPAVPHRVPTTPKTTAPPGRGSPRALVHREPPSPPRARPT